MAKFSKRAVLFSAIVMGLAMACGGQASWALSPATPPKPAVAQNLVKPSKGPVILVSIDGFRADYLTLGISPNLSALAKTGASGPMYPSFPSLTFPNHYTLVTGLRPDHHGLVNNSMKDPARPDVVFKLSDRKQVSDRFWWDGGTPFWVTAEQHGVKVATMFWPGSEADIHGVRPSYWLPFNEKMPGADRVDQVLAWLDLPEAERPKALTLYFDTVDHAGHDFGPKSLEVRAAIRDVDASIGRLLAGLKTRKVEANLIVVADHGMTDVSEDRVIQLDETLPKDQFRLVTSGASALVEPVTGDVASLDPLLGDYPHHSCWRKENIPAKYHYGTHPRISPVVCLAQEGWLISSGKKRTGYKAGAHGFDPYQKSMQALFIAHGPSFKKGVKLAPFDNVNVYSLTLGLLNLTPEPNDGDVTPFQSALAK